MTNAEFLEEYGSALCLPSDDITAEILCRAYEGYVNGDYKEFSRLKSRDQLAVVLLWSRRDNYNYEPTILTEDEKRHFNPQRGFDEKVYKKEDWRAYLDFINLVAERGV